MGDEVASIKDIHTYYVAYILAASIFVTINGIPIIKSSFIMIFKITIINTTTTLMIILTKERVTKKASTERKLWRFGYFFPPTSTAVSIKS